jgi:TPR repeat protein
MRGLLLGIAILLSLIPDVSAQVKVRGYTRKDGTYVAPHMRSSPNGTKADNWSTRGNINPYTGKEGTKPLDGASGGGTFGSRSGYASGSGYSIVQPTPTLTPTAPPVSMTPARTASQATVKAKDAQIAPKAPPIAEGGTDFNDRRAVLQYQQQSAAKGNGQAQYAMGLRYLHGIDVPKDEEKALEYLKAARNSGDLRARDKLTELERAKRKAEVEILDLKEAAFLAEVAKREAAGTQSKSERTTK